MHGLARRLMLAVTAGAEVLAGTTTPWFVFRVELAVVASTVLPEEAEVHVDDALEAARWVWSTKACSVSSSVASSTALSP